MTQAWQRWLVCLLWCGAVPASWAGGSGLNVVVVVNQASTNSVELGNYYCEMRQVPPQNLLRINWPGGNADWNTTEFTNYLLNPLLGMLATRQLATQIDYVVLSMDIPFRVSVGGLPTASGTNSTTSALFYGFKKDYVVNGGYPASCSLPSGTLNSCAGSEAPLRLYPPTVATTNSLLAFMITCSNLAQAKALIDNGGASDGTFPQTPVVLGNRQSDPFRTIRYTEFDNVIFNTRLRGNYNMLRDNSDQPYGTLLGYQNGMFDFAVPPNCFVPGAMADTFTSYSGIIFPPTIYWTTVLPFLAGGAVGTYGAIIEPCAYPQKFPSPQNYFYQARGFSVGECYYLSVTNPYQGLLLGEPLASPFARPAVGGWSNLPSNSLLSGTTNLALGFAASDATHPVQKIDLFVDGAFVQTLTNVAPGQNNRLHVTLDGYPTNYLIPTGATLQSVASNLAVRLNGSAYSDATKIRAFAHGDRIELQATNFTRLGSQVSLVVSNYATSGLTAFLAASGTNLLDTIATGVRYDYMITNRPLVGDFLRLTAIKTNGQTVVVSVTNAISGGTLAQLAKAFFAAVNNNPGLQGLDGVTLENPNCHEDYAGSIYSTPDYSAEFNLRARGPGWVAAQIQAAVSGSPTFTISPPGTNALNTNVQDLRPRAHLYVTAGLTNLPLTFAFNTISQANGYHELTAVAYEGSHVRTQKRISQNVRIQNGPLSAAFTTLFGDTNTHVAATLQFSVVANTNSVTRIELFSTGGSVASVTGQSNAVFSVAGTNLGPGLHPFYALVTIPGKQYRTETKWIRLVGSEPAFRVTASTPATTLSWPATAGRRYEVLSASSPAGAFQTNATVTPSNSPARWTDPSPASPRFYRVRTAN